MKIKMNKKGFTLIELLIVIAIIAILAAIAIPQFAAYRLRAYNTSAISDIHNAQNGQANLFSDWQRFGRGDQPAAPGPGGGGQGLAIVSPIVGPGTAAATPFLTLTDAGGTARGIQIAVGNGIRLDVATNAGPANPTMFTMVSKHDAGDSCYCVEDDNSAVRRNNAVALCGPNIALVGGTAPLATGAADFGAAWVTM